METTVQKELERKAFQEILTHKYLIHGNCFNCGKEYSYFTNKKKSSKMDLFCSPKCFKEDKKRSNKRKKEQHHYEVFKDNRFYYIVVDSIFHTKRDFNGKSWMKKSQQEIERKEDILKRISNWKHLILLEKAEIPSNAIKIIDKISPFLYDEKHPFKEWNKLKEVKLELQKESNLMELNMDKDMKSEIEKAIEEQGVWIVYDLEANREIQRLLAKKGFKFRFDSNKEIVRREGKQELWDRLNNSGRANKGYRVIPKYTIEQIKKELR